MYVFRNAEGVCLICALHLAFGMSLNRQWEGVQDAHEGVEGGGSWGFCSGGFFFFVVLDVSGPESECHIPFSGQTSSLVVNLTPFPPNTGPQTGAEGGSGQRKEKHVER